MAQRHPNGPNVTHGSNRARNYQASQLSGSGSCATRTFLIDELDYTDADLGPDLACNSSSPTVPCPGLPPLTGGNTGQASSLSLSTSTNASILDVSALGHTGQCPTCRKNGETYSVVTETPCDPNKSPRTFLVNVTNMGANYAQAVGLKMGAGGDCVIVSGGSFVDNCQAEHMIDSGQAAGYGSYTGYTAPPSHSFTSRTPNGAVSRWTRTPTSCACCLASTPTNNTNTHCQQSAGSTPATGTNTQHSGSGTNYGGGAMPIGPNGMSGANFSGSYNYTAGQYTWVAETKNGTNPPLLCLYMRTGTPSQQMGNFGSPGEDDANNQPYGICCPSGLSGSTQDCPVSNTARGMLNSASTTGIGGTCCQSNPYSMVGPAVTYGGCGGNAKVISITSSNRGALGHSLTGSFNVYDWPDWFQNATEVCVDVETYSRCQVRPWKKICCCQSASSTCPDVWACN